jgi:Nucleotidyl transferase AbiEii toxin, Type IV TA system
MQDIFSDEAVYGGNVPVSAKNPTNKAASIRQKLLNYTKANGQDFQRTLDAYAIECILDRLAHSAYAERFLLKGALLFAVWKGLRNRPTRDIDLMGRGVNELDSIVRIFKEIVSVDIKDDCIVFFPNHVEGLRIKEDDEYEGIRILVDGALSGATFKVQIDIGFGDSVTPSPVHASFPRILDMPPFSLLMYQPETAFAEKLEAIVSRGLPNSRMKDYFDLSVLIRDHMVRTELIRQSVANTFKRRKTALPVSCPIGLSETFAQDSTKIAQWNGFLRKSGLDAGSLSDVIATIRSFVNKTFEVVW